MTQEFALIVGASIRATIVLLAAVAIAVLLRHRAAAVRHALWTTAIAVVISFPLLSVVLPALGVRNPYSVSGFASAAWARISVPDLRPNVNGAGPSPAAIENPIAARTPFDVRDLFNSLPSDAGTAARVGEVLLLVWLAGFLLGVSRILRSAIAVMRLRRAATIVSDARITSVWRELGRRMTSRSVLLVESDGVTAPGTAGIMRPTIFLPRGAAEWGAVRIRATLAHECAHIERRDCIAQLVANAAVALYWFHPLIWYARRRMITESERACDDHVLRDGVRPERYASVLVETVRESLTQRKRDLAPILSMARPSELETRLVSILDPRRARGSMSRRATLVTASIAIVSAVLVSAPHLDAAPAAEPVAPLRSSPMPPEPQQRLRVTTAEAVADLSQLPLPRGEPDRRGDSIAGPLSERLALSADIMSRARNVAALSGPDSILAGKFYAQLSRSPTWEGDLVADRSAWALSRQRGGLLVEPLIESLADPEWRVRAYAAWALSVSGAPRAVSRLVPLLSDPNWRVRAMAAFAIDGVGDESAAVPMAKAMGDEAWQVRTSAVHFIGALRSPQYRFVLQTALADRHIAVRQAASEAISNYSSHQ